VFKQEKYSTVANAMRNNWVT